MKKVATYLSILLLVGTLSVSILPPEKAGALSGSQFVAGRIIDDFVFKNNASMSASAIQAFLNSKVQNCDTNGTQASGHWYTAANRYYTRAEWGALNGEPAPFTCLKSYYENPTTKANNLHGAAIPSGAKSAAQLIWDVSQQYGLSPKVLIVLLQKEQGLVTDDWPWTVEYKSATGYGCPDTAPCDSQYYGFYNQISNAAWQFNYYADHPTSFNFRKGLTNNISYSPSGGCGTGPVMLQNQSTTNLYIYTPYQTNQAALNNLYGTGDGCSSYGNRNFWRYFNDWFGTPYADCNLIPLSGRVYRLYNPGLDDYFFTDNNVEVCIAQAYYGYTADDYSFTEVSQANGGIPVYRLVAPNNRHFYTTSLAEKNYVVNSLGFADEGIGFTAQGSAITGYTPVYRLASPTGHAYTDSSAEKDTFIVKGDAYEGVSFYTAVNSSSTIPIYRLRTSGGQHFYTASAAESDAAVSSLGYVYEGVAFNEKDVSTDQTTPVYRMLSWPMHFFTPSPSERAGLLNHGFKGESIAFYGVSSSTPGTSPVYRLYRPTDGDHLLTTSSFERDQAIIKAGYKSEGTSFGSY
jgi:hypothetical protein